MLLWCKMGFFFYIAIIVIGLIRMIGKVMDNALGKLGDCLSCFSCCFFLAFYVMGAMWRWSYSGRIASGTAGYVAKYQENFDRLTDDEKKNSLYMLSTGKFMNIVMIIYSVFLGLPCACCILCLPIIIICGVCCKKD